MICTPILSANLITLVSARSEAQTPRLCEERSDAAVQDRGFGLLRYARKDEGGALAKTKEEARNDEDRRPHTANLI